MLVKIIKFENENELKEALKPLSGYTIQFILPHKYEKKDFGETEVLKEVLVVFRS